MPAAKFAFTRYKIINACLTNTKKQYPTLAEIRAALAAHDIDVENRSIERDFEVMRSDKHLGYHAPIAFCRKNMGYYYTDPEYSIDNLPLTSEEIEAFELIIESFKNFRGAEVFNNVAGIFDKLGKVVMHQKKKKAMHPIADFEKVPYVKGIEHFDKLYRAGINQQVLQITYHKFDQPATEHVFHPYLLKEYNFRWYVLGYSERSKNKIILALDRIEKIVNKKAAFKPYTGMDVQQYFDHTIGVTINSGGVKEVQLWCSASQAHYFKTQPLHATQKIISDDASGLVLSLQLMINYELLQTVLRFGAEVKVLKPANLQQQVKDMTMKSMKLYEMNPV